ncbi:hypothetical protein QBC47DRAFT_418109 [Echria macrotheca]|uniref:2EXR domain-containing protein n=1 Tax=Echria macrotheca TaxID=438768 RepID=A0AAJ0F6P1_9PEZI|nr:hypothetical protein QBC47DRAFT_418109 [Echria macrotheca]
MAATISTEIINPVIENDEWASFHLFPALPPEMRLRIWEASVVRRRLLEIVVAQSLSEAGNGQEKPSQTRYSTTNALGNVMSGGRYVATVHHGRFLHSKLLRVNREARRVALRFYRVHMPCWLLRGQSRMPFYPNPEAENGMLYLNPEYDIVHIQIRNRPAHMVVDFMHDVRAHDPRGIGILHLAMDSNTMRALHFALFHDDHSVDSNNTKDWLVLQNPADPARLSLVETVSHLRSVVWMAHSYFGRAVMGPLEDFRGVGVRFVHSIPVRADTATFELFDSKSGGDPRPPTHVKPDLQWVMTAARDPREMRLQWRSMLQRLGLRSLTSATASAPTQMFGVEEKVLFAYEPPGWVGDGDEGHEEHIYDQATARRFMVHEQERWVRGLEERKSLLLIMLRTEAARARAASAAAGGGGDVGGGHGNASPPSSSPLSPSPWLTAKNLRPGELPPGMEAVARPAVGFWMFRADALGPLEGNVFQSKVVFDMRGEWPELGLARLV